MNLTNYFFYPENWKKFIYACSIFLCICCIFYLNANHLNEQNIYLFRYLPLAENILNSSFYSYNGVDVATYPMWGYPALLAFLKFWNIIDYVYYIQFGLAILSLIFFLKQIKKKNLFLKIICSILFLFYTMLLSVKWPDAIMGFIVFMAACSHFYKKYFLAGILLAVAYNFRSETLVFLMVYIVWAIFNTRQLKIALSLIFIVPWIFYGFSNHGHFIPTTTNSGGVLYISLGQLPNNIWEREHIDSEAKKYVLNASGNEVKDPWGYEGGELLKEQFVRDIKNYPAEFVKKLIFNGGSVIIGGLYTIETRYFFFKENEAKMLIKHYKSNKKEFIRAIISLEYAAIVIALDLIIKFFSVIFFAGILIYTIYLLITKKIEFGNIYFLFILVQILLTVFIQYQPRHISHIIVLFVFLLISLTNTSNKSVNSEISQQ